MNLTVRTPAAGAMNPSTFLSVSLRVKERALHRASKLVFIFRSESSISLPRGMHFALSPDGPFRSIARIFYRKCDVELDMPIKIKTPLLLGVGIAALVAASVVFSAAPAENRGAAEIQLAGGETGNVPFPHHRHQEKLNDCNICHAFYPQKAGVIEALKAQGKFKKKQVMNKLCIKCHREKKMEGIQTGPTTCAKCHMKEAK